MVVTFLLCFPHKMSVAVFKKKTTGFYILNFKKEISTVSDKKLRIKIKQYGSFSKFILEVFRKISNQLRSNGTAKLSKLVASPVQTLAARIKKAHASTLLPNKKLLNVS